MQITSGSVTEYIFFVAVDIADLKTRRTGLTSFTVYRSRNGGTATVYTTPTVIELSASNMPGVYALLVDEDTSVATGKDSEEYCLHITQAAMAPITRVIQIVRPKITIGTTITNTDISAIKTKTDQLLYDSYGDVLATQNYVSGAVVTDIANGASQFKTTLGSGTNEFYTGGWLLPTSGTLNGSPPRRITSYDGSTKRVILSSAFTSTPADGVTFKIFLE